MGSTRTTSASRLPDKRSRPKSGDMACIFVHAGAGFHSIQNEHIHLKACNDAAMAAMAVLRTGGTAGDAVEIAIKILEDREVTNAGYGSNLAIDGTVECDAVVVDHNGRSGGIGACAQIKNPITLARFLLEKSSQPLTLRRVPPNFLVGQGATDFAFENGFAIMPHDVLISPAARERWLRWREELHAATSSPSNEQSGDIVDVSQQELDAYLASTHMEQEQARRAHLRILEQGLFNEAQPLTPLPSSDLRSSPPLHDQIEVGRRGGDGVATSPVHPQTRQSGRTTIIDDMSGVTMQSEAGSSMQQGIEETRSPFGQLVLPTKAENLANPTASNIDETAQLPQPRSDNITDTVGAIAIDVSGHIAAGASSGGIGMKHRGRVGPAALVGVGASVIPADASDPDRTCVASVTSGTGEHMATTMAAATCSSRVFHGQRKTHGHKLEDCSDDEAIRSFIEEDFIGHPSVRRSTTAGAIGILTIKMMKEGAYMYFAHNTESFALSSMTSTDNRPQATMSRKGSSTIAQGGRGIRFLARRPR